MPKEKSSVGAKCRSYVAEFGEEMFSTDGKLLFCKYCSKAITATKRSQVLQHLETVTHANQKVRMEGKKKQALLSLSSFQGNMKSQFSRDLCKAFVSADIPFNALRNKELRSFLQKYTTEKIPDESGIRKDYLPELYENVISKIRNQLQKKMIWVSVDETTDLMGRYVANVIVGDLECDPDAAFLIHTVFLEHTNHSTIAKTLNDALHILWPEGIKYDQVLLLVTDGAKYMVKAGKALSIFYTKMIHLTCLAHALSLLCEKTRELFPKVNVLIANVKKIFVKAPTRRQLFVSKAPNLTLPPEPVLTRWGTWMKAAVYYADNFVVVNEIIQSFDAQDSASIQQAQECLKDSEVRNELAFIKGHFAFMAENITALEGRMLLTESVGLILETESKLATVPSNGRNEALFKKLGSVLGKNPGWKDIQQLANILAGKTYENIPKNFNPAEVAAFKKAPIVSCDVERSFSIYKSVLRSNRTNFTPENLKMYMVSHCFNES